MHPLVEGQRPAPISIGTVCGMAEASGETSVPSGKANEAQDDEEWRIQAEAFKTEGTKYGKGCEKSINLCSVEVPLECSPCWAMLLHFDGPRLFLLFLSVDLFISLRIMHRNLYLPIYQNKSK